MDLLNALCAADHPAHARFVVCTSDLRSGGAQRVALVSGGARRVDWEDAAHDELVYPCVASCWFATWGLLQAAEYHYLGFHVFCVTRTRGAPFAAPSTLLFVCGCSWHCCLLFWIVLPRDPSTLAAQPSEASTVDACVYSRSACPLRGSFRASTVLVRGPFAIRVSPTVLCCFFMTRETWNGVHADIRLSLLRPVDRAKVVVKKQRENVIAALSSRRQGQANAAGAAAAAAAAAAGGRAHLARRLLSIDGLYS